MHGIMSTSKHKEEARIVKSTNVVFYINECCVIIMELPGHIAKHRTLPGKDHFLPRSNVRLIERMKKKHESPEKRNLTSRRENPNE